MLPPNLMPIPETTSAEAFERYVGGKCLVACRGKAWREIKAWIIAPPRNVDMLLPLTWAMPTLAISRNSSGGKRAFLRAIIVGNGDTDSFQRKDAKAQRIQRSSLAIDCIPTCNLLVGT